VRARKDKPTVVFKLASPTTTAETRIEVKVPVRVQPGLVQRVKWRQQVAGHGKHSINRTGPEGLPYR
jgi:hypothetical protein